MRFLIIDDYNSGCFGYRGFMPFEALKKRGHVVHYVNPLRDHIEILKWDFVVLNRVSLGGINQMVDAMKQHRIKVLYDDDDAFDLIEPVNVHYNFVQKAMPVFFYLLNQADLVTTTTDLMKENLQKYTRADVKVFPNCINPEEWEIRKGGNERLRIGFAGSNTHVADLNVALDAIIELQDKYDFDFYMIGFCSDMWDFEHYFQKNKKGMGEVFEKHPFGQALTALKERFDKIKNLHWRSFSHWEEYPRWLTSLNLDIGICPLQDTPFNRHKSAIKFYEYAMAGTASIASDVPPFKGEHNYTAKNTVADWKKKLEKLLKNEDFREKLMIEQRNWVLSNRDINLWVEEREQAYLSLLNGK